MHRVLKAGGRAAVTSWGAPERVDVLRVLMRAVRTAIPDYPPPARPPVWLRLADPDRFSESFRRAGFRNVLVESVTRNWRVPSPEWLAQNIAGFSPGLSFIFEALGPERVRRAYWTCSLANFTTNSRMATSASAAKRCWDWGRNRRLRAPALSQKRH